MFISQDIALKDFVFWCGAKEVAGRMTNYELSVIEDYLINYYDGIIPYLSDINDIFWFEDDWLLRDILGIDSEEFWKRKPIRKYEFGRVEYIYYEC